MLPVRDIEAAHIRSANQLCFITGAGASKAAGIPLAGELVKLVATSKFKHCLGQLAEKDRSDYGKVMGCLTRGERGDLILPLLEKTAINWGQIALAAIIQKAIQDKKDKAWVLTFNFDLVLEDAAALIGLRLPVYDFGAAPTADIDRIVRYAILHLHGQRDGFVLLNSGPETQKHRDLLRPVLTEVVSKHVTIVAGYSGEADDAFGVIRDGYSSDRRLMWLGFDEAPKGHLDRLLAKEGALYCGGCDFDRSMIALAQALGAWPPAIISNPMQHLLEQLSAVEEYPVDEGLGRDALKSTRVRLEHFSARWEQDHTISDKADLALIEAGTGAEPVAALAAPGEDFPRTPGSTLPGPR